MKDFSTVFKIWKIQVTSRLPPLIQGVEETVYTVPRLLYGLYSAVALLYWSVIATFSTVVLVGRFSYQLGASTRRYLQPLPNESGLLADMSSQLRQTQPGQDVLNKLHKSSEVKAVVSTDASTSPVEIAIADLTPNAIKKVKAVPPDQTVWVRRWGKGWQVASTPLDSSSWLMVKREQQ